MIFFCVLWWLFETLWLIQFVLQILSYKNNVAEALEAVRRALLLSPEDKAIKAELIRLEEREKKDSLKERDLARKMLSGHIGSGSKPGSGKTEKPENGGTKKV